jgi:nucleoid-associated protein YgaU
MNKEAKIGLAVILVLLVTFAAVVAKRVYTSQTDDEPFVENKKSENNPEGLASKDKENSIQEDKTKKSIVSNSQPTLVAPATIFDKPPMAVVSGDDKLNAASDSDGNNTPSRYASVSESPPSYMPEPPKSEDDDRYNRRKTADGSTSSRPRQRNDLTTTTEPNDTHRRNDSSTQSSDRYTRNEKSPTSRYNDNSQSVDYNETNMKSGSTAGYRSSIADRYAKSASTSSNSTDSVEYRNPFRSESTNIASGSGKTYIAAEGDSLFDIARNKLGKASRWAEIYDLNIDVLGKDIDSLTPGTKIVLPDNIAQKDDSFTRRSRVDYQQ